MSDRERWMLFSSAMCFIAAALIAGVAFSQELPGGQIDMQQAAESARFGITSGQWGVVVGALIMIVVAVFRRLAPAIFSPARLPWIAVALGALTGVGVSLVDTPESWISAILAGVTYGLAAAGAWGVLPQRAKNRIRPS